VVVKESGGSREGGVAIRRQYEGSSGDGNTVCLDCIDVRILVLTLLYNSEKCHYGEILPGKGCIDLYFLQLHVSLQLSQPKKFDLKS
jgi:hypothetical protein